MDNRILVAYALIALMIVGLAYGVARYATKRKAHKIRQSGRGKSGVQVSDN